jgi:hypothetical protein
MESYKESENQEEITDEKVIDLINAFSERLGNSFSVEYDNGTYEIEADDFVLTFTVNDEEFEIRNIDTRGNLGVGSEVIAIIHDYADNHGLEVIASNVLDTAIGFWEKMGYQEGSNESEYFRAT